MRLDPIKDREFLEKHIDKKTGKTLMQLHLESHTRTDFEPQQKVVKRKTTTKPKIAHVITDRVMKFELPYPLTTNGLYIVVITRSGKQKRMLTKEGKAYKRANALLAKKQGAFLMTGEIKFTMHVWRPRRAGDLSNRVKLAEDSLKGIAFHDDEQVAEMHLYRRLDRENPRIEITLEQIH